MLAGIFYGAQYGGSTTAILVNVPGESSAIVTCLDGHQMAKQGRAGPALAIAAIASFVAGTIATVVIATASAPMTWLALKFNAAEYFSLMVLGPDRRRSCWRTARRKRRSRWCWSGCCSASSASTSTPARRA